MSWCHGQVGRLIAGLLVALSAMSGCGSGSEPTGNPTPSTAATPDPARDAGLAGADAVSDLSDFRCDRAEGGRWAASGVITNPTRRTASYAVTVVVSGPDESDPQGKRRTLPALPGEPTPFAIGAIPTSAGADPICSVRVVRLR